MQTFEPYTPDLGDVYPGEWREITDFEFLDDLYIARAREAISNGAGREAEYIVSAEYKCSCKVDGKPWPITVPSGMLTDLASVPWAARGLVGRVGPHLEAAIIHDFLFIAWQDIEGRGAREEDFRFANEIMLQAMIKAKVGFLKRNAIFGAVSSFVARWTYDEPNEEPRYVRVPSPPKPYLTAAR